MTSHCAGCGLAHSQLCHDVRAPACLFPSKPWKYPLLRSRGGEGGEPDSGPGAGTGARRSFPKGPTRHFPAAARKEPGNSERGAMGRGRRRGTNPNGRGGFWGEHSPSSSQPEPAEPRSGASIPAARPAPCSRALRRAPAALPAHPGALPARPARPGPARSPTIGPYF